MRGSLRLQRYNGMILRNKPVGITSHDAVLEVRRAIGQRRVGHTGTLDPRAEGLLVLCLGKATKIVPFLSEFDKTYEAEIYLGKTSTTYDGEGVLSDQPSLPVPDLSEYEIQELLGQYHGKIRQQVPAYSAVKVDGRRLYQMARSGATVTLPEREVEIKSIESLGYRKPRLFVRITCSGGTYIRSIANDLGEKLGCGGYLASLRRTAVGKLRVEDGLNINDIKKLHMSGTLIQHVLNYGDVLPDSAFVINDGFREGVLCGQTLRPQNVAGVQGEFSIGEQVLLKDTDGQVLAIGMAEASSDNWHDDKQQGLFHYRRVLN